MPRPDADLVCDDVECGEPAAPRHSRESRLTSISAALSQLPCLGVKWIRKRRHTLSNAAIRGDAGLLTVHAQVVDDEMDDLGAFVAPGDLRQGLCKFAIAATGRRA